MSTKAKIYALLIAVTIAGLPVATEASVIELSAAMDGPSANAGEGTGSPGTGFASVIFDDVTKDLSWNITWAGLLGSPFAMHFHGPALPNQDAGIQIDTGVLNGGDLGPPVNGSAILSAAQEDDLLNGLWYLNVHTSVFSLGEIRGQVVIPEPSSLILLGAGGSAILRTRRKQRDST